MDIREDCRQCLAINALIRNVATSQADWLEVVEEVGINDAISSAENIEREHQERLLLNALQIASLCYGKVAGECILQD